MKLIWRFQLALLALCFTFLISADFPQNGDIIVEGQVLYDYNNPLFLGSTVEGRIYEDGKFFKKFNCDDKGRFSTSININHDYRFKFSMDYHGTTLVNVSTKLPPEKTKGDVGGIFRFKCEIFERVEGLNMYILNKPLIKIRYVPEKDEFEPDKAWTEAFLRQLEDFKETLAIMKGRSKKLLKDPPKKAVKEDTTPPKTIAAKEEEKEPEPKNNNPRGHRNIMDNLEGEEEEKEELAEADIESEEDTVDSEETFAKRHQADEEEKDEKEFVIPASRMPTINVQPRRQKIVAATSVSSEQKRAIREGAREEVLNKELEVAQVQLNNQMLSIEERNQLIYNKQIQSLRLRGIIKTVAGEEKKRKIYDYSKKPVLEFEVVPEIRISKNDGIFIDIQHVLLVFPTKKVRFRKETYLFGFNYFYLNDIEVSEEAYCENLATLTKHPELCK